MRISVTCRLWLTLLLSGLLLAQDHFILPRNVWRVSVREGLSYGRWRGSGGDRGTGAMPFTLHGYGHRYYDLADTSSYYDLVGLGSLPVSGGGTITDFIQSFNRGSSAAFWGDTLPDFEQEFLGPDSITIGGLLTNVKLSRTRQLREYRIDYGLSDRSTFTFYVPLLLQTEETRQWDWSSFTVEGLDDFITYQQAALQQFVACTTFFHTYPMDPDTFRIIKSIFDRFYTDNGVNTLTWALVGGSDPLSGGITGLEYNPFGTSEMDSTTMDSLIAYYLPKVRTGSELGDISMGMTILLAGKPPWREQGFYSLYGNLSVKMPFGKVLESFDAARKDRRGRPRQFSQYPLGDGSTRWSLALMGELYRTIRGHLVDITWRAELGIHSRTTLNFPVSFLGTNTTRPDSILARFGSTYGYRKGSEITAEIRGKLDLIPGRLSVKGGSRWYYKQPDTFLSRSRDWNDWMTRRRVAGRTEFDTQVWQIVPSAVVYFQNIDPLKKFGSIPFVLEIGTTQPFFTRHAFSDTHIWVGLTMMFQYW